MRRARFRVGVIHGDCAWCGMECRTCVREEDFPDLKSTPAVKYPGGLYYLCDACRDGVAWSKATTPATNGEPGAS